MVRLSVALKVREKFAVAVIPPIVAFPGTMYPGEAYEGVVTTAEGAAKTVPQNTAINAKADLGRNREADGIKEDTVDINVGNWTPDTNGKFPEIIELFKMDWPGEATGPLQTSIATCAALAVSSWVLFVGSLSEPSHSYKKKDILHAVGLASGAGRALRGRPDFFWPSGM